MALIFVSFLAGVLTVLAPCILPLLPVVVGSAFNTDQNKISKSYVKPVIVVTSLVVSVVLFTLLLKATTVLLGVPQIIWQTVSGSIIALFGITMVWPKAWEKLISKTNLTSRTSALTQKGLKSSGYRSQILLGAALGPVFNSCSPTYALLVAAILPVSFYSGITYLFAYAAGLGLTLLVVALISQRIVAKLGWLSDPYGWFRRATGILLILVGLALIFGIDKQLQAFILDRGWYEPIRRLETNL